MKSFMSFNINVKLSDLNFEILNNQGGVSNNSCVCLLVVYRVYYGFDLDQEFPKNPNAPLTYTILTQVSYLVPQTHHQTSFS